MARAFIAVIPPDEVLAAVELAVSRARTRVPGVRWEARGQWHITLQFLGNGVDLDAVAGAIGDLVVTGGAVRLGGAGAFPRVSRGTVLWIGVAAGAGLLGRLAASVGCALSPLGHEQEAEAFRPHLTVARSSRPVDLRRGVEAVGTGAVGPEWVPGSVVLVESRLHRAGAHYRVHAELPIP